MSLIPSPFACLQGYCGDTIQWLNQAADIGTLSREVQSPQEWISPLFLGEEQFMHVCDKLHAVLKSSPGRDLV